MKSRSILSLCIVVVFILSLAGTALASAVVLKSSEVKEHIDMMKDMDAEERIEWMNDTDNPIPLVCGSPKGFYCGALKHIAAGYTDRNYIILPSEGSQQAIDWSNDGYVAGGMAQFDVIYRNPDAAIEVQKKMYQEYYFLLTICDKGIPTKMGKIGKDAVIGAGDPKSGTFASWSQFQDLSEKKLQKIQTMSVGGVKGIKALENGEIDYLLISGATNMGILQDAISVGAKALHIDNKKLDDLEYGRKKKKHKVYVRETLKKKQFKSIAKLFPGKCGKDGKDLDTLSVWAVFFLSESFVADNSEDVDGMYSASGNASVKIKARLGQK